MNLKKLALAAAAGTALLAAAPAFAQSPYWGPRHDWRAQSHHSRPYNRHHYRAPAYVYYPARPVVIAPPAYYYAPPYYAPPPRPSIYGQIPISHAVRIGFGVQF